MKLAAVRRILKESLGGGEKPGWLDGMLSALNPFMEQVYLALNGNLTFSENFAAKEVYRDFTHAVPLELNPESNRRVRGILIQDCGTQMLTGWKMTRLQSGNIEVTIEFKAGGTTKETCSVIILYT